MVDVLLRQIDKARGRSAGLDLPRLVEYSRGKVPGELSTEDQIARRGAFLADSLGSQTESNKFFERIISGNEIQDVNYLARGARAARPVARVDIRTPSGRLVGWGTGFLIAPNVLITNNHVLPDLSTATRSTAEFQYELDIDGAPLQPAVYGFEPDKLFFTSEALDFSVVAVTRSPIDGVGDLSAYGHLPLVAAVGKATEGEWLTIIQHPNGERKQICVRENKLIKFTADVAWYTTDTLGGSSGSPVMNNDWYVVALHHSGVPETKDGRIQTVTGRDFDASRGDQEADIKWQANEGIRVSRIVQTLHASLPQHPMLKPIFSATPENSRILLPSVDALQSIAPPALTPVAKDAASNLPSKEQNVPSNERVITVLLRIDGDGGVTALNSMPGDESARAFEAAKSKQNAPPFDLPFDSDYSKRKGFSAEFLNPADPTMRVNLPLLNAALEADAAPLLGGGAGSPVLKYHNYSAVMSTSRRFAIYSAANVDFGGRFLMSRPPDVWRQDPRIKPEHQVANFYYVHNLFDRGHLTRREDLEFGKTRKIALTSAADTCHWTNCTPQHARFNEVDGIWQGLERHVLEESIEAEAFRAQVITGPILDEGDPVYDKFPKLQYPVRFWKVVAAVNSEGKLFATAFVLDQSDVIAKFGLKEVTEVPFGAFMTFQVKISEVERLTGLTFTYGAANPASSLSEVDPLQKKPRRPRRAPSTNEAAMRTSVPSDYLALDTLDSVVLE